MQSATRSQDVSDEVQSTITMLVRERLRQFGLEEVSVHTGDDHDGDPAIFVDARFGAAGVPARGGVVIDLIRDLRSSLAGLGETRFPYLSYVYPPETVASRRMAKD